MAFPAIGLMLTLGAAACGDEDPTLGINEQLETLAGRELSPAEIAAQLDLADLMCGFDGDLLNHIWARLDSRQLEFQDFVFGQYCPDRRSLYEDARPNLGTVAPENTTTSTVPPTVPPEFFDSISPETTARREARTTTTEDTSEDDSTTTSGDDDTTTTKSDGDTTTTTEGNADDTTTTRAGTTSTTTGPAGPEVTSLTEAAPASTEDDGG